MLGPPSRRTAPIQRPRLLELTRERFSYRLMTFVGGAGFGKSTLIRQALADNVAEPRGIDACIECTADDIHLAELSSRLRAVLEVDGVPLPDPSADARALADAIALRSPIDVCVIIEDAHLLAGAPSWPLVRALLDRLPPNGHLLLSTRVEPDLPVARLAALGTAAFIDEQDLAFTPEECAEFGEVRGLDLTAAPIAWPAMAELAAAGASSHLRRSYLVQEVVAALTPGVRRLLGAVVVAEGADDAIASALMGRPVNVADELRPVPLVHVDDDGWVQPHDLWRQALADLLTPDEQRDAQDVAAITLASRGRMAQGIRLHCDAGNWEAAGRVALAALSIQPPAIATASLAQLLDVVPVDRRTHPGWQLAGALVTYERSLTAARTALERLAERLPDAPGLSNDERNAALVSTMFHLGTIGRRMADEDLLASVAERLAPLAAVRHPRALAVRASVRGFLAQIHGRCSEGLEAFDDVDHGSISAEQSAHVLMMVGNLHLLDGRAETASARYREAAAKTSGSVRLLAEELLATARWAAGETEEAIAAEQHCLEAADRLGLTSRAAQFRAMLSAMLAMVGRIDEAKEAFAELPVELGSRSADGETMALSLLTLTLIELDRGDRAAALAFLARIPAPDGNCQRALFLPAATIVALLPERRDEWRKIEAGLIREAAALGMAVGGSVPLPVAIPLERARALVPVALLPAATGPEPAVEAGAPRFSLGLLGPVTMRRDDVALTTAPWRRLRVRELLAAIALTGPRSREQLAELLWPDQAEGVAARNLRVNLSYLGDALDPDRSRGAPSSVITVQGNLLALSPMLVWVDLATFDGCRARARAAELDNDPAGALAALAEAIGLWRGDVAAEIDAEWLDDIRRQRRAQYVVSASRAGELALAAGDTASALGFADQVLEVDPSHERAGRLQAACLLGAGNRSGALAAIRACLQHCDDMGVDAEPETLVIAARLGLS